MRRTTVTDWLWFLGVLAFTVVVPPLVAALLSG